MCIRDSKNLGPLVATDMTRCIHCTRCVRFLEEIAGTTELGGIGRGERLEISTFIERNINSELSGNIIDVCPVGALTNKPFRFSARPWEMRARASVAGHDCVGSNLHYHVRGKTIMRSVPRDNEAVNECWLSDRDRYSHYGLQAEDRLTSPRIKVNGRWQEASWDEALKAAVKALKGTVDTHGGGELGALISPRATTEEHYLIQKMMRALGSPHIDHRLRLNETSHAQAGRARMDIPGRDLATRDAIFLVGSNIRHDQPILAHHVRTAWRKGGAQIMDLNPVAYDFTFDLAERLIVPPQTMVETLARVAGACYEKTGKDLPEGSIGEFIKARKPDQGARDIAEQLSSAERGVIVLGDGALNHPSAGWLRDLAEQVADATDVALCVLPGPANSQGAWNAGAVPGKNGFSAQAMIDRPRQGYLLWDVEPAFDLANPAQAMRAFSEASSVVAVTAFVGSDLAQCADVLLPLAPVPETDGSYTNCDGLVQRFDAVVKPPGQSRAGWKILRRLGEMLELNGFDFVDLAPVRAELEQAGEIERDEQTRPEPVQGDSDTLWRIGDVGIYSGDSLVRRAPSLQATTHANDQGLRIHPSLAERLGLGDASTVKVRQNDTEATLEWIADDRIAPNAVWLPAASRAVRTLGASFGQITLEAKA